jgi:hypothetical protein
VSKGQLLDDSHPNKCPRCGGAMICYVSSPMAGGMAERRLYSSCTTCGMIAAHNEEDVGDPLGVIKAASR